jgi:hypothetical protein
MKPYQRLLLLLCLWGAALGNFSFTAEAQTAGVPVPTRVNNDANTRKGFEAFYNLDYDKARAEYKKILAESSED